MRGDSREMKDIRRLIFVLLGLWFAAGAAVHDVDALNQAGWTALLGARLLEHYI